MEPGLDYCPPNQSINQIKHEVLSELFDCEPDLLIPPGVGTGAGVGAGLGLEVGARTGVGAGAGAKKQEIQVNNLSRFPSFMFSMDLFPFSTFSS